MCVFSVGLPEETLEGHRDRFNRQYSALRKYFTETRKMKYFDGLVDIPQLREVRPPQAHMASSMKCAFAYKDAPNLLC